MSVMERIMDFAPATKKKKTKKTLYCTKKFHKKEE